MKKFGLFLGGVLTGAVLTFLVLFVIAKAGNGSTLDGATNFEQVGDVVDETSVKVFQVIADNAALVKGQKVDDLKFDWYFGAVYLLRNDDGEYYYDDEIVKRPSGKQFRQTGIYRYNTQTGYKTVPIIELK